MRRYNVFSVLSVLVAGFLAVLTTPVAPSWDIMHVKHAWNSVPMNWENLGPPPVGTTINLHIFLKPHHENALVDALYEVSTPKHPKYGAHLTKEQVADLLAPAQILSSSWLTLTGVPVSQANDLLGASFQLYQHTETNHIVLRTISYALPAVLHAHVDTVVPTTYFGSPRAQMKTPQVQRSNTTAMMTKAEFEGPATLLSSRDEDIVPSDLRSLYKTENYVPAAAGRNGVHELISRRWGDATFTLVQLNGGTYNPSNPDPEGDLNIEYTSAIAYPTPNVHYSVGELFEDGYYAWLRDMLTQLIVPPTVVTTYGGFEHNFPVDHAVRLCILFAALGTRGVSVLFASGNSGVGGGNCRVTDGFGNVFTSSLLCSLHLVGVALFSPLTTPSNSSHHRGHTFTGPYVTAVGGTKSKDPEIATPLSGGGFSTFFGRPDYQDDAVPTFLQNLGNQYNGFYKYISFPGMQMAAAFPTSLRKRRISSPSTDKNPGKDTARAVRRPFVFSTIPFSAPFILEMQLTFIVQVVGAIISLLNDYRISQGKPPLGFLNPWLYGGGLAGLNDITFGSNPGCGTNGFSSIVGWDPVTGLGTPDFEKLLRIVESMEN
ncbi:peptidase S8/S53 domain-containing protein [Lactarius quietus]|nr:peptidase S8/S53 domain-containing protein [Lactarius quietus]